MLASSVPCGRQNKNDQTGPRTPRKKDRGPRRSTRSLPDELIDELGEFMEVHLNISFVLST